MTNKNGDLYVIPTPLNEDLDDFYTPKQKKKSKSYSTLCS